jgi:hypothetical protein
MTEFAKGKNNRVNVVIDLENPKKYESIMFQSPLLNPKNRISFSFS